MKKKENKNDKMNSKVFVTRIIDTTYGNRLGIPDKMDDYLDNI